MKFLYLTVLLLCLAGLGQADEEKKKTRRKPFGLGQGPAYIGGRDTDSEGDILVRKMYTWYINYMRLTNKATPDDEAYYKKWYATNDCIGACPGDARCHQAMCYCDPEDAQVQIYGQCVTNTTAYFTENSNQAKFRKPTPPPLPEWCWKKDKDGRKKKDPQFAGDERCEEIEYPNSFDHNTQYCEAGRHSFCQTKDMNMFCSQDTIHDPSQNKERNHCICRKDMKFDTRNMECRIYMDVDCTYVAKSGYTEGELAAMLKGEKPLPPPNTPGVGETQTGTNSETDVTQAFCFLIDGIAEEYNEHIAPPYEFSFLGLGFGALVAVCCGSICAACCCCKCCNSCREKIRAMDPRNATRGMGTGTQMAALGAVAASEYMENKEDRNDAARIAAMQGGVPGAPPGYAPVPTGYPPQQPGYPPQQPGYPAGPGYPPAPAGYPPAAQPGGYIPPADKGFLGDMAQMAPELALAGAGVATGNTMMAGMGAVAAMEKLDGDEEKEDRLRAAALKGVPPPPMGYAGAPPPGPLQSGNPLPPSTANYPRQQMQ